MGAAGKDAKSAGAGDGKKTAGGVHVDTERQREILKSKHARQLAELGETNPSVKVWRKRCWSVMASSSSSSTSSIPQPPSLDEAVNLMGLAPESSGGVLASELGLLIYNSQADETKKIMAKMAQAVKDQAKEIKEGEQRAVEAAAASKPRTTEEEAKAAVDEVKPEPEPVDDQRRRTRRRDVAAPPTPVVEATPAATEEGKDGEEEEDGDDDAPEVDDADDWVQCEHCDKWRRLPPKSHARYPKILAESWKCNMNDWDELAKNCSAPEESANKKELSQVATKIRIWLRRIKSNDKYAKSYAILHGDGTRDASMNTRGVTDWIRCTDPQCGKWRACLRNMSAKIVKDRYPDWTCWMNSWDETRASCTAPQEGSCVRSLAQVELDEQLAAEEEKKALAREAKHGGNGLGRQGGFPMNTSSKANDDEDEIEYTRGVSQRGRIVRSRWTAQARRRFLGK